MDNVTFKIIHTGNRNLGRCYNATTWRIESSSPMSWERIQMLRKAGLLGGGQEFFGNAIAADGTKQFKWDDKWDRNRELYVYEVEDRVDSSD